MMLDSVSEVRLMATIILNGIIIIIIFPIA